jgi:hypothetical protein
MTLVQKIQQLVLAMTDYGFTFFHDDKWGQNLQDDSIFPVVYLDFPIQSDDTLHKTGAITAEYTISMLFGKKSELDWTMAEHETNCIEPMRTAARKFLTRLQNDNSIREVKAAKRADIKNFLDVNISGCVLTVTLTLTDADSICV